MTSRTHKIVLSAVFICALLLLGGCGIKAPVQYYQLSAMAGTITTKDAPISTPRTIGLDPVALPEYLERPQIITRLSANQVAFSQDHRWAEPLADNLPRVLQENLASLFGPDAILLSPWPQGNAVDMRIKIQVLQFENTDDGVAHLTARWSVFGRDKKILLPERRSSFVVTALSPDPAARVAALSATLADLSREINKELGPLLQ